jgi:hypothetical protein
MSLSLDCDLFLSVSPSPPRRQASVFGLDDIYKELRPFMERWRELKRQQPSARLYMVSVDVRKAFDSVDIERLVGILEPALKSNVYTMLRWAG